ncbi:allophanate hydrolase subunit 1 [Deinococcus malanensis]|uniref:5-oxoprolinase subunit B family protein n=1 Tax=Deinococcus malanensis TaxID=1706855 RepID=UPI003645B300
MPALNVLTVLFDSLQVDPVELEAGLRTQLSLLDEEDGTTGREVIIPVVFNGQDLGWCAAHVELSTPAFIEALCNLPLEVAFLGFTPGFAFLTGLPPTFQMPRLTTPRERVPAGSVALGGPWAGVYPRETPGGWRLIGHTDAPCLISAVLSLCCGSPETACAFSRWFRDRGASARAAEHPSGHGSAGACPGSPCRWGR